MTVTAATSTSVAGRLGGNVRPVATTAAVRSSVCFFAAFQGFAIVRPMQNTWLPHLHLAFHPPGHGDSGETSAGPPVDLKSRIVVSEPTKRWALRDEAPFCM